MMNRGSCAGRQGMRWGTYELGILLNPAKHGRVANVRVFRRTGHFRSKGVLGIRLLQRHAGVGNPLVSDDFQDFRQHGL